VSFLTFPLLFLSLSTPLIINIVLKGTTKAPENKNARDLHTKAAQHAMSTPQPHTITTNELIAIYPLTHTTEKQRMHGRGFE
jgi:hypothetical protein